MKFRSHPAPILEAWATWETFRKLGFKTDDLFWVFENTLNAVPTPGLTLAIKLLAQGKDFRVTCSHRLSAGEARRLETQCRKFIEAVNANSFDQDEMNQVLRDAWVTKNQADLLIALKAKGFEFPFLIQRQN